MRHIRLNRSCSTMGRHSRSPKHSHRHKSSKHRRKSRDRSPTNRISSKSRFVYIFKTRPYHSTHLLFHSPARRKRSISVSSASSSSDSSNGYSYRKKGRDRKTLSEVERLAEMDRQRRQKETENRVGSRELQKLCPHLLTHSLPFR